MSSWSIWIWPHPGKLVGTFVDYSDWLKLATLRASKFKSASRLIPDNSDKTLTGVMVNTWCIRSICLPAYLNNGFPGTSSTLISVQHSVCRACVRIEEMALNQTNYYFFPIIAEPHLFLKWSRIWANKSSKCAFKIKERREKNVVFISGELMCLQLMRNWLS